MASLTDDQQRVLAHDWRFWGRPSQQPPDGDWWLWFIVAGRAWGKNRTAAAWLHDQADCRPGAVGFIAARTLRDVRDTVLGNPRSGLIATARPWNPLRVLKQEAKAVYANGTELRFYSSEEPDQARGPEHDFGYGDEFATWKRVADMVGNTLYDNLLMGLRGSTGGPPCALFTSTPRPSTKAIIEAAALNPRIRVTRGRLIDNQRNLPREFVGEMLRKYEGTRLGRQELDGEILDAIDGALWSEDMFDRRVAPTEFKRVVVAVDPAVSTEEKSNQTGIVKVARGWDDRLYGLAVRSAVASPAQWARRAIELYHEHPAADAIVGEVNNGGDLVEANLHANGGRDLRFIKVHATRGKARRAEPVAALYEQGRASHCGDPELWRLCEYQMTMTDVEDYNGEGSPDDMDALVWGAFELFDLGERITLSPAQFYGVARA